MYKIPREWLRVSSIRCYSTKARFVAVKKLQYDSNDGVQNFNANEPTTFKQSFNAIPAIEKWFKPSPTDPDAHELSLSYLEQHGDSIVPLELTRKSTTHPPSSTFERFEAPLSLLLAHMTGPHTPDLRLYLAQHSLADLSPALQADLPAPTLLAQLGRADIYASSLWMGRPPTRTPLHRDPNPNLFVQLAGRKVVRMMRPEVGRSVYERVRAEVGLETGKANMRGEEMMADKEMESLEVAVWDGVGEAEGVEAEMASGDGLYIPLGWWHAVRSVGTSANASVSDSPRGTNMYTDNCCVGQLVVSLKTSLSLFDPYNSFRTIDPRPYRPRPRYNLHFPHDTLHAYLRITII